MSFKIQQIASRIALVFLGNIQNDLFDKNSENNQDNKFLNIVWKLPAQKNLLLINFSL